MKFRPRCFAVSLLFLMLCLGTVLLMPWQSALQKRIITMLEQNGFHDVSLHLDTVSLNRIRLDSISLNYNNVRIKAADITLTRKASDPLSHWQWSASGITLSGTPLEIPVTSASGKADVTTQQAQVTGLWTNADNTYTARFEAMFIIPHPEQSSIIIADFAMPFQGGRLTLAHSVIPFSGKPYTLRFALHSVPVDVLLKPITGEKAKATGIVSGTLPIVITPGKTPGIDAGALKAETPGTIAMPPEAIPGDNPQIDLLRDVMKDFHYSLLSLQLQTGADHKLAVVLALEGNNPSAYNGRPVKLHVQLSGDVLDFITQSMAINNPSTWIKQGTYAK